VYDPHAALTPEKHIQVALQHKQEGRLSKAMRTLTMAILQHSDNKDLYAVRGSLYLEQGQPSEALRDLEKALKLAPDDSELLTNRAQVCRQFGQIAQALNDLNRTIELNPDLVAARFNRGAIHYSSEEFKMSDAISAKNTTR
jgi:tetratricopeptide (TPR) repeat protein